jgi:hypothetical protein
MKLRLGRSYIKNAAATSSVLATNRQTCGRVDRARRTFLRQGGACLLCLPNLTRRSYAQALQSTLLSAPLEIGGNWGGSPRDDARAVILRVREVCLSGIRLLSDRQPEKLRVDNQSYGLPHIWLNENPDTAWIVVNIGALDWSKLSYQFGHELGHVLCNSWARRAEPKLPSQWLEEALVEAFSIRGLGLLANSWEQRPPFPRNSAFADSLRKYRHDLIEKYRRSAGSPSGLDMCDWINSNRGALSQASGIGDLQGPVVLQIVTEFEGDKACVEDLGALNRWPARSEVPTKDYLRLWQSSCGEIGAPGRLPARLARILCFD